MTQLLRRIDPSDISVSRGAPFDPETMLQASEIIQDVRNEGEPAIRRFAERFGERRAGEPLVLNAQDMATARDQLDLDTRTALEAAADRIRVFSSAQRQALSDIEIPVPGGVAGHRVEPIQAVGCYAPAGRYPLPSSVLMTVIPAKVAGCDRIVAMSPGAHPVMLAAASIAGADEFVAFGGAHGIAAMTFGYEGFEPVDFICGPGNRWVTAAKQHCSGAVGIDMLAGPSELLIIADETANAAVVAADLLAQAEHDPDARPLLATTHAPLIEQVEQALSEQLARLATSATATTALKNGWVCLVHSRDELAEIATRVAPEHLEVLVSAPRTLESQLRNAGAIFFGSATAEVLGDYGIGPNHTLPTAGTARYAAGLSVLDFVRVRTHIEISDLTAAQEVYTQTEAIARIEGLDAHAASARARLTLPGAST